MHGREVGPGRACGHDLPTPGFPLFAHDTAQADAPMASVAPVQYATRAVSNSPSSILHPPSSVPLEARRMVQCV